MMNISCSLLQGVSKKNNIRSSFTVLLELAGVLIIYYAFAKYLKKKRECNEEVHQLFIDFKKAFDSVRREVLYKILNEFGIPKKLVRLIKMSMTETYSRVRVGKNVSDRFPVRNGLKQGDALSPML